MAWFNVDDSFYDHPKVERLRGMRGGEKSLALWILAGSWSAKQLTDGVVERRFVTRLGFSSRDAQRLVAVRLWEITDTGFLFHDWLDWQRSKDQILAERAANRGRKAKSRARRHGVTSPVTNSVTPPVTAAVTPPSPPAGGSNPIQVNSNLEGGTRGAPTGARASPRATGPPPTPDLGHDSEAPGRRCWALLEQLTAGAVGDWHGARQHCQRAEAQARHLGGDGWQDLLRRVTEAWVERQRERNRPLVARYLADDFAEVAQTLETNQTNQDANGKQTNFADRVRQDYERREKLLRRYDSLKGKELVELEKLKPNWQKYKDNGDWYDRKATG